MLASGHHTLQTTNHKRVSSPLATASRLLLSEYFILALTLLYFLAWAPFLPTLSSKQNLTNIFLNTLPLLAVAIGQTVVLVAGGIDLSVTAIIAMSSVVGAKLMVGDPTIRGDEWPVWLAILAMTATGAGIGLFNGLAVTLLNMPAFIVTLTSMMFFSALAVWTTLSKNIGGLPDSFLAMSAKSFGVIPNGFFIVIAIAVVAHLMLAHTVHGRWIYAVGANPKTARVSGVPVRRITVLAYVVSGLCAAAAGMLYTARLEMGSPTHGERILLDVIGAVVIGGTSLFGGKGKILWTLFGVLFLTLLDNTLFLADLQHAEIMMIKGAVILAAAGIDQARVKWLAVR